MWQLAPDLRRMVRKTSGGFWPLSARAEETARPKEIPLPQVNCGPSSQKGEGAVWRRKWAWPEVALERDCLGKRDRVTVLLSLSFGAIVMMKCDRFWSLSFPFKRALSLALKSFALAQNIYIYI